MKDASQPIDAMDESVSEEEMWTPVQVASFLGVNYQRARNAMLEGRYGLSHYDAKSRRLTVRASLVRAEKNARDEKRSSSARKREKSRRAKRKH